MRKQCTIGFTLVEILTVIAIIAVLAAILFAVFASSRDKGKQSICLSHLRQLGQALSMYRADYDGDFPIDSRDLNRTYVHEASIYFCPADNRPDSPVPPSRETVEKGFGAYKKSPSYIYHSPHSLDQIALENPGQQSFTNVYVKRGDSTPIMVDDWHNSLADKQSLQKSYLVLRVDGSVHTVRPKKAVSSLNL